MKQQNSNQWESLYEMARVIANRKANGLHYREDIVPEAYLAVAEGVSDPSDIQSVVRKSLRREWKIENSYSSLEIADSLMRVGAPERARLDLGGALASLDKRQREVVVLMFWEGLTQEEIAETLGVGQPQVCKILAHALYDMKIFLDDRHKTTGQNTLGK